MSNHMYSSRNKLWTVINSDGDNLFIIDYVPPIGSTITYSIQPNHKFKGCSQNAIDFWREMDGKTFIVTNVHCDVRNYGEDTSLFKFVEVSEKEDKKCQT